MDKLIVIETPPLFLQQDGSGGYAFLTNGATDYRPFLSASTIAWVHESTVNLQGYAMQDLTTYFRQSFEQQGAPRTISWSGTTSKPLTSSNGSYFETTIVTTVPMTDDNLAATISMMPGFIGQGVQGLSNFDYGNFNRDQIIHGRFCVYGPDTVLGSDSLDGDGSAYVRLVQEYDFSSLEPVATDKLYCYRILAFAASFTIGGNGALTAVAVPPKRILLDSTMQEEAEIPYLMRLKRGYELANQV